MPAPLLIAAGIGAGLTGLSALFGRRANNKRNNEQRQAQIAAYTLAQKQREDARRSRLSLGSSILGRIPTTTAGGRVNTNAALDPELVAQLGMERTYNFSSAVPNENAGGGSAFLSGLFGGASDVATTYASGLNSESGGDGPGTVSIDDLLHLRGGNTTEDDG